MSGPSAARASASPEKSRWSLRAAKQQHPQGADLDSGLNSKKPRTGYHEKTLVMHGTCLPPADQTEGDKAQPSGRAVDGSGVVGERTGHGEPPASDGVLGLELMTRRVQPQRSVGVPERKGRGRWCGVLAS